jgi:hypothetical protein
VACGRLLPFWTPHAVRLWIETSLKAAALGGKSILIVIQTENGRQLAGNDALFDLYLNGNLAANSNDTRFHLRSTDDGLAKESVQVLEKEAFCEEFGADEALKVTVCPTSDDNRDERMIDGQIGDGIDRVG